MTKPQLEESVLDFDPIEKSKLPKDWKVESLADGSLRVMQLGLGQRSFMAHVTLAIFWCVVLLLLTAIVFGFVSFEDVMEFYGSREGAFPITLVGLLFVYGASNGGQEWIVSHNRLELRWAGNSPNFRKSHIYKDGEFGLHHYSDSDGNGYWQLDFKCRTGFINQGGIDKSYEPTAFEDLHYLGSILSAKTGWPLKIPSEMNGKNRL